jgi:hypothetical protein
MDDGTDGWKRQPPPSQRDKIKNLLYNYNSVSVRACVCPFDATVPRFNGPAELARTVGFCQTGRGRGQGRGTHGPGPEKTGFWRTGGQTGQGGAGVRAGLGRGQVSGQVGAGGRARRAGQGPNKE